MSYIIALLLGLTDLWLHCVSIPSDVRFLCFYKFRRSDEDDTLCCGCCL